MSLFKQISTWTKMDDDYIREIKIIKQSRPDAIPDIPIAFSPLENLHLEFLENKKKLKKGAPLIPRLQRRPPRPKPTPKVIKKTPTVRKAAESGDEDDKDLIEELGGGGDDGAESGVDEIEIELAEEEPEFIQEEYEEEPSVDDPYAGMSPEEIEKKKKQKYLWKFYTLKKKYKHPTAEIPDFNEHSDLDMMKSTYQRVRKEILLDDNVETYRMYLAGGFMAMEYACTQWLGLDLTGFSHQQSQMMHKYNPLLIELGEREYNSWGSNLPVEVRLIGMIIFQGCIFYLGKVVAEKFGTTVTDLFKGFTGQPPEPTTTAEGAPRPQRKKKRMRGPKLKPDDIRRKMETEEIDDYNLD